MHPHLGLDKEADHSGIFFGQVHLVGAKYQTLPACWGALSYLSPGPSAESQLLSTGRRVGRAMLVGRREASTCCHGSEPTYQRPHRSLIRPRCLVT